MSDQPSVDIGGGTATPVSSTFQSDTINVRFVLPASSVLRAPSAVAWVQNSTRGRRT